MLAALDQTLLMAHLVLGLYLSYRILRTTDLTVDGSFVLGAAAYARALHEGLGHLPAVFLALMAGSLAGICVALIQKYARLPALIASILMLFMLYSINFEVMGKPNLSLLSFDILADVPPASQPLVKGFICLIVTLSLISLLAFLLRSRHGLLLRAHGTSPHLLTMYRKSPTLYQTMGLATSNALAALCGVLTAQFSGYADITMGFGMSLTGIGALVMGSHLFQHFSQKDHFSPLLDMGASMAGLYLYFVLVHGLLALHVNPIHLKLFVGLVLIVSLRHAHLGKKVLS